MKLYSAIIKTLSNAILKNSPRDQLLQNMPKNSICAEIGVWKGDFSQKIAKTTSPKELHLIDPWSFQGEFPDRMYGGSVARNQRDMDNIYQEVKNRFSGNNQIILHREKSAGALNKFPDNYFDWLYIDGNHYYEYVLADLEISLHKVKKNGIIAGDDYTWGRENNFPVKRAVHDFTERHNLQTNLSVIDSQFIINLNGRT